MVSDLDVYRAANALIKELGNDASFEAAMKADKLLEAGDLEGKAVWLRILAAVDEILRTRPRPGERRQ